MPHLALTRPQLNALRSCAEQYEEVQSTDASGNVVTGREVLYGGTRHGVAVGGTRYYMGAKLIKA